MGSYEAVRRGVHVGVRYNPTGLILDLTDDANNEGLALVRTTWDDGSWGIDQSYRQVGSDDDVTYRWNSVVESWNCCCLQGVPFGAYNARGDHNGANCENLVGYVLENDATPRFGFIVKFLHDNYGLDLTEISRFSRSLSSSSSS